MGYLISDHSAGQGPDGLAGKLEEWDTVSCEHCQKVIRILVKGFSRSGPKYRCSRCKAGICKECAGIMEQIGQCPGPFRARVEAAVSRQADAATFAHNYRSCSK